MSTLRSSSFFLLFLLESNQFGEGEKIYGGKDRSIRANCWRVERRGATISRIGERERERNCSIDDDDRVKGRGE